MAAISTLIAAVGVAASIGGSFVAYKGQQSAQKAQKKQVTLQARRSRRDQVRKSIIARSQALQAGTDAGAQFGSGVAGGMGSITSQSTSNIQGINQNVALGEQVFAGQQQAALGGVISSLGGMAVSQAASFGRIGSFTSGGAIPA